MNNQYNKYNSQNIINWIKKIANQENAIKAISEKIHQESLIKCNELSAPIKHFNVAICGKTGIGKSTLINELFNFKGDNTIPTGIGKPITKGLPKVYESDTKPFRLYDSQGIELKHHDVNLTIQEIESLIETKAKEKNPDCFIHAIWYCIGAPGYRIEDSEKEAIQQLKSIYADDKLPIIIVLTQAYDLNNVEEFMNIIKEEIDITVQIIPVLARESSCCKPYGLDQLLKTTFNEAIKSTNSAFLYSLQIDLTNKLNEVSMINLQNVNRDIQKTVEEFKKKYQSVLLSNINKADIINVVYNHILSMLFSLKDILTTESTKDLQMISDEYCSITAENVKLFLNEQITEQAKVMTNNYIDCKIEVESSNNVVVEQNKHKEQIMQEYKDHISTSISNQIKIMFQKVAFSKMIESFSDHVQKESCFIYEESLKKMKGTLLNDVQFAMEKRVQELSALTNIA